MPEKPKSAQEEDLFYAKKAESKLNTDIKGFLFLRKILS
ncbi:hypothetical protein SBDP1_920009 [Syntrophobacter sp. SbD1]|nr:hypothetical protein SBDP1_920009 [Syntrophobacter sp. SbD1]